MISSHLSSTHGVSERRGNSLQEREGKENLVIFERRGEHSSAESSRFVYLTGVDAPSEAFRRMATAKGY